MRTITFTSQVAVNYRAWNSKDKKWEYGIGMGMGGHLITNHNEDYTVVPWTGLYDKNGTKVYHGDIVTNHGVGRNGMQRLFLVHWDKQRGRYLMDDITSGLGGTLHANEAIVCEVVGNIFENPEMIPSDGYVNVTMN